MANRKPLDARSTGRKRGRAVLEKSGRPFECSCTEDHDWHTKTKERINIITSEVEETSYCGWAPVGEIGRDNNLDCNHKNKNILDNDPANLEWLCRRCHREIDRRTEKGVSIKGDEFGYGLDILNG